MGAHEAYAGVGSCRKLAWPSLLVGFIVLSTLALGSAARVNANCDIRTLRLATHTGPYQIVASKELGDFRNAAPYIRVRIINPSAHRIVVGGSSPRTRVTLNFVTPRSRGILAVAIDANGRGKTVRPKSSVTFDVTYPYRLGRPGLYEFNVSYDGSSSNIVRYVVAQ